MIISQKYKITFLKNPKTGGTAIHKELNGINLVPLECEFLKRKISPRENIFSKFNNSYYGETKFVAAVKYFNLQYYIENKFIPGNAEEYTNYVIVREPVDRFSSFCRHVRNYANVMADLFKDKLDAVSKEENIAFKKYNQLNDKKDLSTFSRKFIETYKGISFQEIAERLVETPFNKLDFIDFVRVPQSYYYDDPRVTVIDYARLQEGITAMCVRHKMLRRYIIPKMNVGIRLESDSLSKDLINKIKLIYAEDVEFYAKLSSN